VKIGDTEGIVEVVGFRSTRVRTFYNSLVTVPNAHFTESAIDNIGLRQYRRVKTTLGLTYDTAPEQIQAFVEGIRAIIVANPHTRKDYYEIHFNDFGAHSLDIMVYLFLRVDSWSDELRERHNILLEILRLAKELEVDFAFPTQTLHLDTVAAPGAKASPKAMPQHAELGKVVQSFGPGGQLSRPGSPFVSEGGYLASTIKKVGGDG
jgi:MscS family membrane protein